MLRLTVCFLITAFLFVVVLTPRAEPFATLTRVTNTPEHTLNLNPTLSDDGRTLVFESTADLAGRGKSASFHALRVELAREAPVFDELGTTRAVCPAVSGDGRIIVFASNEDLVGGNADRNSEIFLFDGSGLKQLTQTEPATSVSRPSEGNFQPSITSDGRVVVFSSNRDLTGANSDLSFEIFLYDQQDQKFAQLTNASPEHAAVNPKISTDGSRVYYKRTTATDITDLVLIETASLTTRVLAANVSGLSLTEGRAVSNDGMRLVYSALTAPNQSQVFMFDGRDNSVRQLTQLGSRTVDVALQPTISGDGRRIAFATRRRVLNASDGGVELYVLDLPSGQAQQITNAPAAATAEVISSLNLDGSLVAFSFPRILSGTVSDDDLRNNSEIYLASIAPRPIGVATIVNAAAKGNEPQPTNIAPGSVAHVRGSNLALKTETANLTGDEAPFTVAGTTVSVNNQLARIFYVSPDEVVFVVPNGLASGPAQFLVTNSEGLSSMAAAQISPTAPGIFTTDGGGHGEAVVLNSDTFVRGPFDPSGGALRLTIFATGIARANNVSVTLNGRQVVVEAVAPARLLGFDEIHVLVPAELRGAGTSTLIVIADGVQSNSVSIVLGGTAPTPTPTPSPTPTPTPSPSPTASPTPSPTPTPTATPTPSPSPTPTPDTSPHVVISQIFGGGGNAGAPFRNDFIEIFNAGNSPVNLAGWSVQYASATASTWSVTPLTSVTLAPGQYYLVQESSGGSTGAALPAPDATGSIAMAAGSGKVGLVRASTTLTGTCPSDPNIVDLLGYGNTANCFRGSGPAVAPSNTNALLRAAAGCTDTRNNFLDFALGPPNPRNTNFLQRICTDP